MDRRSVITALGALAVAPRIASGQASSLIGSWNTFIYTEDVIRPLRWRFEFRSNRTGTFRSVDQPLYGAKEFAIHPRINGSQIAFDLDDLSSSFKGKLAAADRIEGVFDYPAEGGKRAMTLMRGEPATREIVTPRLSAERLDELRRSDELAGLAVAVAKRGESPRVWVAGERKRGSSVRIADTDLWPIASCSKSFTATLIGRLVDQGRLHWTDTVDNVLGASMPEMLPTFRSVTLRHLLAHRAGLTQDAAASLQKRYSFDVSHGPADRLASSKWVLARKPEGPIGAETYLYSNVAYQVAAAMAEARSGRTFEELMRTEVFEPLELSSAQFLQPTPSTDSELRMPGGHPSTLTGGAAANPAGGIVITLLDLLKYLAAHRDEPAYLKAATWQALHTDPFGKIYALGWHIEDVNDGGLIHGGAFPGWMSKVAFNRKDGTAMAAATNDRTGRAEALLTQSIHEGLAALNRR